MQRRLTAGRGPRELVRQYPATLMAFGLLQDKCKMLITQIENDRVLS